MKFPRLGQWMRRVQYPLALALITTLITFVFGVCASMVIQHWSASDNFLSIWKRWDAVSFLTLAQHGYGYALGEKHEYVMVMLPVYPATIWLVHLIVREWHLAALLISNLCCAGAFVYLFLLAEHEYNVAFARRAVFFFAIFPTAYFLHVGYSESTYLVLAIGSFYHARREQWAIAALLGALATAARLPGLAIAPALLIEYLQQRKFQWRALRFDIAWLALIPLGACVYLWINYHYFGNPFFFVRQHRQMGSMSLQWPGAILVAWHGLWHGGVTDRVVIIHGAPFVAFIVGSIALLESCLMLRPAYAVYMALNWFIIFCNTSLLASPRYVLALFPLFLIVAHMTRRAWLRDALAIASLLFYALFALQFTRGWWAF